MASLLDQLWGIELETGWTVAEAEAPDGHRSHLRQILQQVLSVLREFVGADHAYVAITGIDAGLFRPFAAVGRSLEDITPTPTVGKKTLVSKHIEDQEPIRVIPEPCNDSLYCGDPTVKHKTLIWLIGHGELAGFISLDSRDEAGPSNEALAEVKAILPFLWRIAADAIFSMRLRDLAVPLAVGPGDGIECLCQQIAERAAAGVAADAAIVRAYEADYDLLVVEGKVGDLPKEMLQDRTPGEAVSGRVFASQDHHCSFGRLSAGRYENENDIPLPEDETARFRKAGVASYLTMRLDSAFSVGASVSGVGTLSVLHYRPHQFSWRDTSLLGSFCQRAASRIALFQANAKLVETNRHLRVQSQMFTNVEVISLVAHDLFYKSFAAWQAVDTYVGHVRKAMQSKDAKSRKHPEGLAETALQSALVVQRAHENLRDLRRKGEVGLEDETEFQLEEIVSEIESTMGGVFSRNNFKLDTRLSGNLGGYGRKSILTQVLFNLVVNAVDAARRRRIKRPKQIHVHAHSEGDGINRRIIIQFWDDGPGIDRSRFRRPNDIFEIGMTTKKNGTGTGLPVARSLLGTYFGGQLVLEDAENARFRVSFPADRRKA